MFNLITMDYFDALIIITVCDRLSAIDLQCYNFIFCKSIPCDYSRDNYPDSEPNLWKMDCSHETTYV